MSETFKGLVPGRHVFYEHAGEKTLCGIVAKVLDGETGRVNLAILLGSGMWINMREVQADPSCGGPAGPADLEGFMCGRWRWMFEGQATALTETHAVAAAAPQTTGGVGDPAATAPGPNTE